MLEIPESRVISAQLSQTITSKTIQKVAANTSAHKFAFYTGDPESYPALLVGKKIEAVTPIAGQIEITAGDMKLVFSDGVNVRYFSPGDPAPEKHQLRLDFQDGSFMVCTIQMYGFLAAFQEGTSDNPYYLVAREKPSPLTDAFDQPYFDKLLAEAKKTLSVKALLATEQRIPGLGNGVLQDILFNARINPRTRLDTLTRDEKARLFQNIKSTLMEMTALGGRDTEKDLFGNAGGYRTKLSNKTLDKPCPVCGGRIVREAFLGGNVYYCPACQPVKK